MRTVLGRWNPSGQNKFSDYLGEVIKGWARGAEASVASLFNGDDESIDRLWELIKDGKLNEGKIPEGFQRPGNMSTNVFRDKITKTIFGFGIPHLWRFSGSHAFILDSGADCNAHRPVSEYLSDDTMDKADVCVNGRRYYLVMPDSSKDKVYECFEDGSCETAKFILPPGFDSLSSFGGVTKDDLVVGSVNTWVQNGRRNGDPVEGRPDVFDSDVKKDLFDLNIRIPGFMKLPVCSPERARLTWDTSGGRHGSTPNWPCDLPPGRSHCGMSTFEDRTHGGSPLVSDCLQIIRNIEGDGSTDWTHLVAGKPHREILQFGTCRFGIEATHIGSNINFRVGGQDVIDIINDSVQKFGRDGRVAARGEMECSGSSNGQGVLWGIYT